MATFTLHNEFEIVCENCGGELRIDNRKRMEDGTPVYVIAVEPCQACLAAIREDD